MYAVFASVGRTMRGTAHDDPRWCNPLRQRTETRQAAGLKRSYTLRYRVPRSVIIRLPPDTGLGERMLGAIFGVSRTRIRQVLFRLATAKVIPLSPNHGAFVART